MSGFGSKMVRKPRTNKVREQEIQKMYDRKPNTFEDRALECFPLRELYDTSATGKRIRELLELSDRIDDQGEGDVSYLEEAGALLTFQAARNPYSTNEEVDNPPWHYPKVKHKPIPTTRKSSSAVPDGSRPMFHHPSTSNSQHDRRVSNTPAPQQALTPQQYLRKSMDIDGASSREVMPALQPQYNGWVGSNHGQPQYQHPATDPRAYHLLNRHDPAQSSQNMQYHTSGMPSGINWNGQYGSKASQARPSSINTAERDRPTPSSQPNGKAVAAPPDGNSFTRTRPDLAPQNQGNLFNHQLP